MQAMYTASMAQAHTAYLQMAQASLMGLAGMPAQAGMSAPAAMPVAMPTPMPAVAPMPAPAAYAPPAPAAYAAPAPAPAPGAAAYAAPAPAPAPVAAPAPVVVQSPIAAPVPAPIAAPVAASAPVASTAAAGAADIHAIMLRVVAESTGYPSEMLSSEMALEGDLGIDSIKRVEILSAVQDEVPGLPQVDANHMGALETLGEIVEYMQGLLGPAPAAAAAAPATASAAPAAAAPAGDAQDVHAIMLEVVAESTGYPSEMLSSEMALEGDLGIDSIKRVEILSAVQDRIPGLPDVDANHMGALETLGEIVEYMQGLLGGAAPARTESLPFDQGVGTTPGLGRFVLETVPAPATGFAQPGLFDGPVAVTQTDDGLSNTLVACLRAEGVDAHEVEGVAPGTRAVIYLGGLRRLSSIDDATATQRAAFAAARTVAQSLDGARGLWVTVQDTGGAFGLTDMTSLAGYTAGLAALTRTAAHEWPAATTKAIDLERGDASVETLARRLADELLRGGVEREVGLAADGSRQTIVSRSVAVSPGEPGLSKEDVIVVSGGARGVTAACVIEWAYETQATFILLGRTPLEPEPAACAGVTDDAGLKRALLADAKARGVTLTPAALGKLASKVQAGREVRETIARVQEVGGRAVYVTASVTDAVAVQTALDGVRSEIGPITGVVHAAGVLADKWIAEKSDADFAFVFDTKIDGLRALLDATAADDLKVLAVFSSVAARCGNQGQCDYAMANEVLTKVCMHEARRRPSCIVKSFGWGPWEGGMVTPQLRARFEALGVPMIPIDVGARMFVDELVRGGSAEVDLVFGGEPKAEPLLGASEDAPAVSLELAIGKETHPHFADHTIQGTPVVPLVAVVDWFSRAIRAVYPGRHLAALEQVRVLRGIRLDGFASGGDRFVLRVAPPDAKGGVALRLESLAGIPHYNAVASLADGPATATEVAPSLRVQPWTRSDIYGDVLFHGAQFRVIAHVEGMSDEGAIAVLSADRGADWPVEPSAVDVAGLDGGLQLALLLTEHMLGAASLPMGIERVRTFGPLRASEPTKCIATARARRTGGATTDLVFVDASGQRIAELTGVQTVLVPETGVASS
jgi:acyl carrier protein